MDFTTTLYNVLIMFFYMIPTFILTKFNIVIPAHSKTISAILLYILCPALMINSFQNLEFSWKNLLYVFEFLITVAILMCLIEVILYFILKAKYEDARYRMLTIAAAFGNVGFFGLPLIKALYPEENIVQCYSAVYTMAMTIMAFTIGVFCLTNDSKYISVKKALLNPIPISAVVAVIIYITKWKFPEVLANAFDVLTKMTTPLCMHILGIRLATGSILELFKRPFIYIGCALKLILFPLFSYVLVRFLPFFNEAFKGSVLILGGAPSAAVILAVAELYETETELAANVVLLSTILSVVTLPVITLLADV